MVDFVGEEKPLLLYFLSGLLFDLLLCFFIFGTSLLLQSILWKFKIKKQFVSPFLFILIIIINGGLITYFQITKSPLDETVFYFSLKELKVIAGSINDILFQVVLGIAILIVVYIFLSKYFKRFVLPKSFKISLYVASFLTLLFVKYLFLPSENRTKEVYSSNRMVYFIAKSNAYFEKKSSTNSNLISPSDFEELNSNVFPDGCTNKQYPLLHPLNQKSIFSTKFKIPKDKKLPNIVFIVVESLSSDFIGNHADQTGNVMPFLDSLSNYSLYFPNFISTCHRTFNVLPASLASVPNSTDGAITTTNDFTPQMSLQMLLNSSYKTRFYCGVDLSFTNMNGYMNNLGTNYLVNKWNKKYDIPFSKRSNPWGYPDGYLFSKSWEDFRNQKLSYKPRFDVFLTISTHDPFVFPKESYYLKKAAELGKSKKIPKTLFKQLYSNPYLMASFAYTDDALKSYFERAKKMPEFENTIFFIYGDHGTPLYSRTPLSRYNVPLVVYSPLLKKPEQIKSVNSHLDLAPTLLNFLKTNYGFKFPSDVTFIGKEFEMENKFTSNRTMALLSMSGKNESFLDQNQILLQNQLFKILPDLKVKKVKSKNKTKHLQKQIRLYDLMSKYCFNQNKIIPEYLFQKISPKHSVGTHYSGKFKLLKHIENIKEIKSKDEYLIISEPITLKNPIKRLRIKCQMDYLLEDENSYSSMMRLTAVLQNISKDSTELIFWKTSLEPTLLSTFKKSNFNTIVYYIDVNIDKNKEIKKNNKLTFYFSNSNLLEMKVKNMKTEIFVVE